MEPLNIKKLDKRAILPTYGTTDSAGADLYALLEDVISIEPGETIVIPTGLSMAIPKGYVGLIYARSSLGTKRGLAPANKVGVIDADYRGEVKVALHNDTNEHRVISGGERIAQLVVIPYVNVELFEVDKLSNTERGEGGFGSTGV